MNQLKKLLLPFDRLASDVEAYLNCYRYVYLLVTVFIFMPFLSNYVINWLTPLLITNLDTEDRLMIACTITILPIYGLISLLFYYFHFQLEAKLHDGSWLSALGYFLQVTTTFMLGLIISESNTYFFSKSQLVRGISVSPDFSIRLTMVSLVFVAGLYVGLRHLIMTAEKSLLQQVNG